MPAIPGIIFWERKDEVLQLNKTILKQIFFIAPV